jgi:hypothetical protein
MMVVLGTLLALGCSDTTSPAHLNGTWASDFTIPGSGLEFTLATNGDAVTGAGQWTGEACCSGSVQIVGTATSDGISLDFAFTANGGVVPPHTNHFTGRLTDENTLTGTMTSGDQVFSVGYHRV